MYSDYFISIIYFSFLSFSFRLIFLSLFSSFSLFSFRFISSFSFYFSISPLAFFHGKFFFWLFRGFFRHVADFIFFFSISFNVFSSIIIFISIDFRYYYFCISFSFSITFSPFSLYSRWLFSSSLFYCYYYHFLRHVIIRLVSIIMPPIFHFIIRLHYISFLIIRRGFHFSFFRHYFVSFHYFLRFIIIIISIIFLIPH